MRHSKQERTFKAQFRSRGDALETLRANALPLQESFSTRILCDGEIDLSAQILRTALASSEVFRALGKRKHHARMRKALHLWKALGLPRLEFALLGRDVAEWVVDLEKALEASRDK